MKNLKPILNKFLKKEIKDELGCNDGDTDLLNTISKNIFLEDVTGGSYLIIEQEDLIGCFDQKNKRYFVFNFDQMPLNKINYKKRYSLKK